MGNAPSLSDHARLRDIAHPIIGTNRSWSVAWPNYHLIAHLSHATEFPHIYHQLVREERLLTFTHLGVPGACVIPQGKDFAWSLRDGAVLGFPAAGGSVVTVALQLAAHMGCKKVFLLGCDLSGGKFYDPQWNETHPLAEKALQEQVVLFRKLAPLLAGRMEVFLCGARPGARNDAWPSVPFEACLS